MWRQRRSQHLSSPPQEWRATATRIQQMALLLVPCLLGMADSGLQGLALCGCHLVRYCGEACRDADWARHRQQCRRLQRRLARARAELTASMALRQCRQVEARGETRWRSGTRAPPTSLVGLADLGTADLFALVSSLFALAF